MGDLDLQDHLGHWEKKVILVQLDCQDLKVNQEYQELQDYWASLVPRVCLVYPDNKQLMDNLGVLAIGV